MQIENVLDIARKHLHTKIWYPSNQGIAKLCVTVLKGFRYISKYLHNTDKMTDTRIVDVCRAGCCASHAYDAELSRAVGRNLMVLVTVFRPSKVPSSSVSSRESMNK